MNSEIYHKNRRVFRNPDVLNKLPMFGIFRISGNLMYNENGHSH